MIKKIFCALTAVLSCAVIIMGGGLTASAAGNSAKGFDGDTSDCGVIDGKGLFDSDELGELNEIVRETAEKLDMYILIYLSDDSMSESSTQYFADQIYGDAFGPYTDGVCYYMDLSGGYSAYDFIFTSGKAMLLYDDSIDSMLNGIFDHLPASGEEITASEIYDGIKYICYTFEAYGEDGPSILDYEYVESLGEYVYFKDGETIISSVKPPAIQVKALGIALLGGIVIAVICYFIVKAHYKFKKSCNPNVYVSREDTHFTRRDDHFIRQYTTRTKIESSSGGGSRGGGGGGSRGGGGGGRR